MTDALSLLQQYADAWNSHDRAALLSTFAEGGTYTDPLAPGLRGDAIADYAEGLWEAFPDLSFELAGTPATGDGMVTFQWLMKGTNTGPFNGLPPSGLAVALPGADFIRIEGGKIRSVQGYFDAGEVPRQLGLQVVVQPAEVGPFCFGTSTAAQSGKKSRPAAFSITSVHARSDEEMQQIRDSSRAMVTELLSTPGFIGWTGMTIGRRLLTVTAWEDVDSPREFSRKGIHAEVTRKFFGTDLTAGGFTSVWVPDHFNPTRVRCTECGRMEDYEKDGGRCACGQTLPEAPPYW